MFAVLSVLGWWAWLRLSPQRTDMTVNFDDPELALEWGTVTVWILRAAALLAFVAALGSRVRRSRLLGALAALAGL